MQPPRDAGARPDPAALPADLADGGRGSAADPSGAGPDRHLRIEVDDICSPCPGAAAPCAGHIVSLLGSLDGWSGEAPILIHCVAGVSRSMAAALITATSWAAGRELELALGLRQAAPHAQPNSLMIELADAILGCGGRLVAAAQAMGPATPVEQAPLVRLTVPGPPIAQQRRLGVLGAHRHSSASRAKIRRRRRPIAPHRSRR